MKSGIFATNGNKIMARFRVNLVLLLFIFELSCKRLINREFFHCYEYFINPPNL